MNRVRSKPPAAAAGCRLRHGLVFVGLTSLPSHFLVSAPTYPVPSHQNNRKASILQALQKSQEHSKQRSFLPGLCVVSTEADWVS